MERMLQQPCDQKLWDGEIIPTFFIYLFYSKVHLGLQLRCNMSQQTRRPGLCELLQN